MGPSRTGKTDLAAENAGAAGKDLDARKAVFP
jgi:hypothetical protein